MSEMFLQNRFSSETLVHVWNFWKKKILSVLENLQLFETHLVTKNLKCWDFCCEYFGALEIEDGKLVILNSKASWIRENDVKYAPGTTYTYMEEHQFVSAARSYWSSELLLVGQKVVMTLQQLDKFAIRKSLAPLSRATVLLRIFELLKFIVDSDLSIKVNLSTVHNDLASVPLSLVDIIFPINWRLISFDMIKLRENDLSTQLLKEVLRVIISGINSMMTYGNIGKMAMLCFANGNLDQELYEIVIAQRELFPQWKMFFECAINKSRFGKFNLAMNLQGALRSTFEIDWQAHDDYITPQCFIYLAERLLFYSSSCKGMFYTTKAYLMESLCCLDWTPPLKIDNQIDSFISETFSFLASIIHQLLFNKVEMLEWVKKSSVNTSKVYPLLVLRLVVIISLIYLNSGQHLEVLLDCLCWRDIISSLPQAFCNYLRLVVPGASMNIFADALATVDDPLVIVCLKNNGTKFSCSDAIFIDMNIIKCREEIFDVLVRKNEEVMDQSQAVELGASGDSFSSSTNANLLANSPNVSVALADGVSDGSSLVKDLEQFHKNIGAFLEEHKMSRNDNSICNTQQVKSMVEESVPVLLTAMSRLIQGKLRECDKDMLREINVLVDDLKKLSLMFDMSDSKHEINTPVVQEHFDRLRGRMPKMHAFLALLKDVLNSSVGTSAVADLPLCDKGKSGVMVHNHALELGICGDMLSLRSNRNPQETNRDHCVAPTDGVSEDSTLLKKLKLICTTFGALLHEHKMNRNDTTVPNFKEVQSMVEDFVLVVHSAMSRLNPEEIQDCNKDLLDEIQILVDDLKKLSQMLDDSDKKHEINAPVLQEHFDRLVSGVPKMQASLAFLEDIQNASEGASAVSASEPDRFASRPLPFFRLTKSDFREPVNIGSDEMIEVETVDRARIFLGSLWESKTNVAVTLLEAGLAKLQTSFGLDRIPDAHLLAQAE